MQTFIPYHPENKNCRLCFSNSASVLDRMRLGKQRVECLQILNVLTGISKTNGWRNHPAVLMWKGFELSLIHYSYDICLEWVRRGYKDTCLSKIENIENMFNFPLIVPFWINTENFYKSHRSNLLRKFPEHYNKFKWTESNDIPYYWPTQNKN